MGRFDNLKDAFDKNDEEGGQFFKIADGKSAVVAFLGEPVIRETYWDGKAYLDWTPECGQQKNLKTKMNVAVFHIENGKPVLQGVQILEQGKKFFKDVMNLDAKYGLDTKLIEITREGTGTDTEYTLLPECDIDAALRKQLAGLVLHDLHKPAGEGGDGGSPGTAKEKAPATMISQAEGDSLIENLRTLNAYNADITTDFLKEFGIRKIRELTTDQLARAKDWVETELNGMKHAQADSAGAADPFA